MVLASDEQLAWCDRVADYFALNAGLPPITGRTMAWLMICDPPEQSPSDLSEALGVSRASLTSTLRLLQASGLVRRSTRPGSRATYYRVVNEAWAVALRTRLRSLGAFVELVEDGRRLVGDDPASASRLGAVDEVYRWFADEIGPLWERWEDRRESRQPTRSKGLEGDRS